MSSKQKHKSETGSKIKAVPNPHLDQIKKILATPALQPIDFKAGPRLLSVSTEIIGNPKNLSDWKLAFLAVPDISKLGHLHYFLTIKEAKSLRIYINRFIKKAEAIKR